MKCAIISHSTTKQKLKQQQQQQQQCLFSIYYNAVHVQRLYMMCALIHHSEMKLFILGEDKLCAHQSLTDFMLKQSLLSKNLSFSSQLECFEQGSRALPEHSVWQSFSYTENRNN